jgi:hypothetical protein
MTLKPRTARGASALAGAHGTISARSPSSGAKKAGGAGDAGQA